MLFYSNSENEARRVARGRAETGVREREGKFQRQQSERQGGAHMGFPQRSDTALC